jgi:hypothetical protein
MTQGSRSVIGQGVKRAMQSLGLWPAVIGRKRRREEMEDQANEEKVRDGRDLTRCPCVCSRDQKAIHDTSVYPIGSKN